MERSSRPFFARFFSFPSGENWEKLFPNDDKLERIAKFWEGFYDYWFDFLLF